MPTDPTPTDAEREEIRAALVELFYRSAEINSFAALRSLLNATVEDKGWRRLCEDVADRILATARRTAFAEAVALVEGMQDGGCGCGCDADDYAHAFNAALDKAVAALRRLAEGTP